MSSDPNSAPPLQYNDIGVEDSSDIAEGVGAFLKNPKAWVVSLLAGWVITNLFIRPFQYFTAGIARAWETVLGVIDSSLKTALGGAGSTIYLNLVGSETDPGAVWSINLAIGDGLRAAGLAGPIVSVITTVFMLSIGVVLTYLLVKIAFNLAGGVLVS